MSAEWRTERKEMIQWIILVRGQLAGEAIDFGIWNDECVTNIYKRQSTSSSLRLDDSLFVTSYGLQACPVRGGNAGLVWWKD